MNEDRMKDQKDMPRESSGKVLSFEQDGGFYFRRGLSKLDKNNLLGAMADYRVALSKDPQNEDVILGIAEVLTAMERFEESNRMLMSRFSDEQTCPTECYFGMGCNFAALREFEQARINFERYVEEEPGGEFVYDAYDMLDALDEDEDYFAEEEKRSALYGESQLGHDLMEKEDFEGAVEAFRKVVEKDPGDDSARNSLALAYYCAKNYDGATEQVGIVLKHAPEDLQAHCNLAVFMSGAKDEEGMRQEIEFLKAAKPEDLEDLNRVAVTLLELKEYESALKLIKKLVQKLPYDCGVVHRLAACAYSLGDYELAIRCYDKLLSINDNDSIAKYYRSVCVAAEKGEKPIAEIMLSYQVPLDETFARINALNGYIAMPPEELKAKWYPGGELESLVRWGLTLPGPGVKRAILRFIASFRDALAEIVLRDFVLQRAQSIEVKKDAFGLLKYMGAPEPYLSYVEGELMESRVSLVAEMPEEVPAAYAKVLERCMGSMRNVRPDVCLQAAAEIWGTFTANLDGFPPLSTQQSIALSAALEYLACHNNDIAATKTEICGKYAISLLRLNGAMSKLKRKQ